MKKCLRTALLSARKKMTQINQVYNQCVITHDSFYLNAKQSFFFTFFSTVAYLLCLVFVFSSLYAGALFFVLLIMIRNPLYIEVFFQRGLGDQYNFHWSIHLGFFRLFCVNFRLFGLSGKLAQNVKVKLDTFRDLHHD